MNADRIAEAYYGEPTHPSTQRCRRRIHWMCAQATGRRVLDIGCSQGIVSLILAREGFDCTGVDLEEASLEWARQQADREPEMVRTRLRFQAADATALPFEDASFDTAFLGEILEHLTQPTRVLEEVRRILKPGGRVVVTVPLGLNHCHPDHKQTFYPTSLTRVLRPFFRTVAVTALDSWVTYAGINDPAGGDGRSRAAADDWANRELESYCVKVEAERRRLRGHVKGLKETLRGLQTRVEEAEGRLEQTAPFDVRLQELERTLGAREAALAEAEAENRRLAAALAERQEALEALATESAAARRRLEEELERRLVDQNAAMVAAIDEARREVATSTLRKARNEAKAARQAEELRQFVRTAVPAGSRVLVVSKGDDRLVQLDGRGGAHFPQGQDGGYAGFHPPDGNWAVAHLRKLGAAGAGYLLVPATSFWWLDHYVEFGDYLKSSCTVVAFQQEVGLLLALTAPVADRPDGAAAVDAARRAATKAPPPRPAAPPPASPTPASAGGPGSAPVRANGTAGGPVPVAPVEAPSLVSVAAVSDPPPHRGAEGLALGAVLDAFTTSCLKPEARLITFRPDNWHETLERHRPDAVFVESAWQGNDGAWKYRIATYPTNKGDELLDLVRWARERRIPTVFWNKEDPVHFERFLARGGHFDHVFTTDANCIDRYRARLGHDRVHDLPFAAQPLLHNPVQSEPRTASVCFAGTYYGDRHDERRRDLAHVLEPALDYGLDIYDRRFGIGGSDAGSYTFPERFQPAIRGRLEYDRMVEAYKRYRVFLNVNSVKDSPTMFSRRVFELLACGTPVISSHARGLVELLGEDTVFISDSEADTRRHLDRLLNDDAAWARASLRGVRRVLDGHTYGHRLRRLLEQVGLQPPAAEAPRVAVIARVSGDASGRQLAAALASQSVRPAGVVLLADEAPGDGFLQEWRNRLDGVPVRAVALSSDAAFAHACEAADAGWVALCDDRDHYGPEYLRDYTLATQYAGAALLGKQAFARANGGATPLAVGRGGDFRVTWSVASGSLVVRRPLMTADLLQQALRTRVFWRAEGDILSTDRFNYLQDARPPGAAGSLDPRQLREVEA